MDKDENQLALQEIKSLTNELQIKVKELESEVFASCFDIDEVDFAFGEVEELVKKARNQINLMLQFSFEKDKE